MIYFVQSPAGGPIKIGTTIRLTARLAQLQVEYGQLVVLGVSDGTYREENFLHQRFSQWRITGEWYAPAPNLLDFIRDGAHPWDGTDEVPDTDKAVKIARELWVMMNFILDSGSTEYESVAEYLTAVARPAIERDYEKAQRHFQAKPKKGGGE